MKACHIILEAIRANSIRANSQIMSRLEIQDQKAMFCGLQ